MKDFGTLKYFLGIEVSHSKRELFLSQQKNTLDLLNETGNSACEPVNTLIEVNHNMSIYPNQIPTNKERYQSLAGKLMYLIHTIPDISYAVSMVSQFMHNPSYQHMSTINHILASLKSSPSKGILFSKHGHLDIEGYTDSYFPSLFNLALNKEATIADIWDRDRGVGCWSPTFLRPLNDWEIEEAARFLHTLHEFNYCPSGEDKLLLKNDKEKGFSVKSMYKGFDPSPAFDFPYRLVWNPVVPPKIRVFAWEATWGKVLTLNQLKRRGMTLVNRCFMYEEDEENIDHLLIHCKSAKMLWNLFLSIVGTSWVFPQSVLHTLLAWQGTAVGKKRKRIWLAAPLCLFWTPWRARNRLVFENEGTTDQKIKANFVSNLWAWANVYTDDKTNSVVEFLTWLGSR